MKSTRFIFFALFLVLCLGCSYDTNQNKNFLLNDNLISQKVSFVSSEFSDLEMYYHNYDSLAKKYTSILEKHDTIVVSKIFVANECSKKQGNIDVSEDSIVLQLDQFGRKTCSSEAIYRVDFVIKKPKNKNYIVQ